MVPFCPYSMLSCSQQSAKWITLKALDIIGLKTIVSIKTYLVTNNRELLIVYILVRNCSLWSNVVFENDVIEAWIDPFTCIRHLKAQQFVQQGCCFFHFPLATWWPIHYKFSEVCYFMHNMLGYTKWEYWSFTITKRVHCTLSLLGVTLDLVANILSPFD